MFQFLFIIMVLHPLPSIRELLLAPLEIPNADTNCFVANRELNTFLQKDFPNIEIPDLTFWSQKAIFKVCVGRDLTFEENL